MGVGVPSGLFGHLAAMIRCVVVSAAYALDAAGFHSAFSASLRTIAEDAGSLALSACETHAVMATAMISVMWFLKSHLNALGQILKSLQVHFRVFPR